MYLISPSSLQIFPDEILLMIFSEMDIFTLLSVSNVCKTFKRLANVCLVDKFKEQNVGLSLTFGQEHRLRTHFTMEFNHINDKTGNFIFLPKNENPQLKFYHSNMLKSPKIYKVTLDNATTSSAKEYQQDTARNLLQKSMGCSIKSREGTCKKSQNVYRTGNGISHLKVPFETTYSITDIPPPNDTKSRGGERWITPLSFECPPSFFYPNEATVHRIIMSVLNYKPNIKKQQTIKKPVVSNASQKQRDSFQQQSQVQPPVSRQVPKAKPEHEKKNLLTVSSRWIRGARS